MSLVKAVSSAKPKIILPSFALKKLSGRRTRFACFAVAAGIVCRIVQTKVTKMLTRSSVIIAEKLDIHSLLALKQRVTAVDGLYLYDQLDTARRSLLITTQLRRSLLITTQLRRFAEQDAAAQRYAATVLQEKYEEAMASVAQMEKIAVMAESILEATLQYQSGQVIDVASPRNLNWSKGICNFFLWISSLVKLLKRMKLMRLHLPHFKCDFVLLLFEHAVHVIIIVIVYCNFPQVIIYLHQNCWTSNFEVIFPK